MNPSALQQVSHSYGSLRMTAAGQDRPTCNLFAFDLEAELLVNCRTVAGRGGSRTIAICPEADNGLRQRGGNGPLALLGRA